MTLPPRIAARIDTLLKGTPLKSLAMDYAALSERYRRLSDRPPVAASRSMTVAATQTGAPFQIASTAEALAYTAARMPATFGAVSDVLSRLAAAVPDFSPASLLDVGAGPGTATLAALSLWPDIANLAAVEPNRYLRDVAAALLPDHAVLQPVPLAAAVLPPSALVLSSYVLNELPPPERATALHRLWDAATDALVIVEPGTPLGYGIVLEARDMLLAKGAHIAAPCPHHHICPLAGTGRWCHFSARIARSSLHRAVKGDADLGYEDEKFSYLAAVKAPASRPLARIIGHPRGTKLVSLELCNADGTASNPVLSKRDPLYKQARRAGWGDALDDGAQALD